MKDFLIKKEELIIKNLLLKIFAKYSTHYFLLNEIFLIFL